MKLRCNQEVRLLICMQNDCSSWCSQMSLFFFLSAGYPYAAHKGPEKTSKDPKETEPEYPGRSLKDNFTEEKFLQIKPAVGVYSFVSSRNSFKGIIEIIPVQTFMGR